MYFLAPATRDRCGGRKRDGASRKPAFEDDQYKIPPIEKVAPRLSRWYRSAKQLRVGTDGWVVRGVIARHVI
jgi:hypothetical protein